LRLTFAEAVTPARILPQRSFTEGVGPSTSKVTCFVTPRIVRSPVSLKASAPK
jgi:hypothetical protein